MAIPSRQIGWGTEENLLYEVSKQLEQLTAVISKIGQTINTTTTTTTSAVASYTITDIGGKSPSCTITGSTQTVYAASSNINSIVAFYTNPSLTTPFVGDIQYFVYTNGVSTASAQIGFDGAVLNPVAC